MAMDRLSALTTWIGVGASAALGLFAVIAAATIPGKASADPNASAPATPANASASTTSGSLFHHRHRDGATSTISASSAPPVVVTGGSR